MKINTSVFLKLSLANVAPKVLLNCFMQRKINAIFTKRVLKLNDSLGFNDSLSLCNRALMINFQIMHFSFLKILVYTEPFRINYLEHLANTN